jgi:putative chitinase
MGETIAMMRAIDVVRRIAPTARPEYLGAWDAGDDQLADAKVDSPLRLAHVLAQCGHESGGFTLTRESMRYSKAARIAEIFLKVQSKGTPPLFPGEADMLVMQERDIGDRFYGIGGPSPLYAQHGINNGKNPGNPKKAEILGNTRQWDGFAFRGNGMLQTTGGDAHQRLSLKVGVDFHGHPEFLTSSEHALTPVLWEWTNSKCNTFADRDDLLTVSRAINMGNPNATGTPVNMTDRREWLDKARAVLVNGGAIV